MKTKKRKHYKPKTYYISPFGSDSNNGLSPLTPWQTIGKVNDRVVSGGLKSGNRILFHGGETITTTTKLDLYPTAATKQRNTPYFVGSYGGSKATIQATNNFDIIQFYNLSCVVKNIKVLNSNYLAAGNGIYFYADSPNATFEKCIASNLEIDGVNNGIAIFSYTDIASQASTYKNIFVSGCVIRNIKNAGVQTYSNKINNHSIVVRGCDVRLIYGFNDAAQTNPTGHAVVLGSVKDSVIETSFADGSGVPTNGPLNAVHFWLYNSSDSVIRNCISVNATSRGTDGDGFDLDINTYRCTLEYNYAYNARGSGMHAMNSYDSTIRHCVVEKCAQGLSYGGIYVFGGASTSTPPDGPATGVKIYNNTVYHTTGFSNSAAFRSEKASNQIDLYNNAFFCTGTLNLIHILPNTNSHKFYNNAYWGTTNRNYKIGTPTYTSLTAMRSATGYELLNNQPTGIEADPLFVAPGTASASGFQLQASSPLRGAGWNLQALLAINPGAKDYFGNTINVSAMSLGAHNPATGSIVATPTLPTYLFRDNFTGTSGAVLSSRNSDSGRSYTRHSASTGTTYNLIIGNNNSLRVSNGTPTGATQVAYYSNYATPSTNFFIEFSIIAISNIQYSIGMTLAHSSTVDTLYGIDYQADDTAAPRFRLYKIEAGTLTLLGSYTATIANGLPTIIRAEVQQNGTFTIFVNGTQRIAATDTSIAINTGFVGYRAVLGANKASSDTTGARLDEIKLAQL